MPAMISFIERGFTIIAGEGKFQVRTMAILPSVEGTHPPPTCKSLLTVRPYGSVIRYYRYRYYRYWYYIEHRTQVQQPPPHTGTGCGHGGHTGGHGVCGHGFTKDDPPQ